MARKPAYPTRITVRMLRNRLACTIGIEEFQELFPSGFEVTRSNLLKAINAKLKWDWALEHFLASTNYDKLQSQIDKIEDKGSKRCRSARKILHRQLDEAEIAIPAGQLDSPTRRLEINQYRQQQSDQAEAAYRHLHDQIHIEEDIAIANTIADFLHLP